MILVVTLAASRDGRFGKLEEEHETDFSKAKLTKLGAGNSNILYFSPPPGEMIQFHEDFSENHQLVNFWGITYLIGKDQVSTFISWSEMAQ